MYPAIVVSLWTILSISAVLLMVKETNRRIAEKLNSQTADDTETVLHLKPYKKDRKNLIILSLIAVISAVCAWFTLQRVTSVFFCIEVGLCYISTLGASVVDFKLKKIPNIISILLFIAGIFMIILQSFFIEDSISYLLGSVLACFTSFSLLFIAGKLSKGGIGMGDIKLISAIGLTVGLQAVFISMILSLLICLVAMLSLNFKIKYIDKSSGGELKKNKMAFAPFLYLGFTVMILFFKY